MKLRAHCDMAPSHQPPPQVRSRIFWNRALWVGILLLMGWATFGIELSVPKLISGFGIAGGTSSARPTVLARGFFLPISGASEYI